MDDWQDAKYLGEAMASAARTDGPRETWPEELQGLGGRLKFARERIPMTKSYLSEKSGVDQGTLSKMEDGKRLARIGSLLSIAKVLGVPPEWFLLGKGTLPEPIPPPPGATDQRGVGEPLVASEPEFAQLPEE